MTNEFKELYDKAIETLWPEKIARDCEVGGVATALITDKGNIYTGVCIDVPCSIGFCAEHNAIGSMITNRESKIKAIVSVFWDGEIASPCGRCRELINQVHDDNGETEVLVRKDKVVKLKKLLPYSWDDVHQIEPS